MSGRIFSLEGTTEGSAPPRVNKALFAGAVVLLVLNTLVSAAFGMVDAKASGAYGVGYAIGAAAVPLFWVLIICGGARLVGAAKTRAAQVKVAFWTLVVVTIGSCGMLATRGRETQAAQVTEADRQGLAVGTDSIRHAGLGFALPHPGRGFEAAPDLQRQLDSQLAAQPNIVAWIQTRTGGSDVVVVEAMKLRRLSETGLRTFARSFSGAATRGGDFNVLEDTVLWNSREAEYRFSAFHPAGVYVKARCVARRPATPGLIVCVQTRSDQPNGLDRVRSGLVVNQ